jgi:GAF domain-containing protein
MTAPGARSDALLDSIVQVARAIFGARAASILMHDEPTGELVFAAVAGEGEATMLGRRFPSSTGIAGWVLSSRQPLVIEDVTQDPRFASDLAQRTGYLPKGLMAAPLLGDEGVLGVLEVLDRPQRTKFSLIEIDLLGLFAHQAAIALDAQRHSRQTAAGQPRELTELWAAIERLDGERRAAADALLDALTRLL